MNPLGEGETKVNEEADMQARAGRMYGLKSNGAAVGRKGKATAAHTGDAHLPRPAFGPDDQWVSKQNLFHNKTGDYPIVGNTFGVTCQEDQYKNRMEQTKLPTITM